ncbi:hypothetical protein CMUS01_10288 [Colletotrichum musicola]|uniref:Uncharacterized protein n=1 Tax=Colletotrichum musicola TaxID=2175873 RepID=A0A8H6N8J8_9PEZI|nr:hypothetical protein CMUS01_10288 [Colletotrichum musicola]
MANSTSIPVCLARPIAAKLPSQFTTSNNPFNNSTQYQSRRQSNTDVSTSSSKSRAKSSNKNRTPPIPIKVTTQPPVIRAPAQTNTRTI